MNPFITLAIWHYINNDSNDDDDNNNNNDNDNKDYDDNNIMVMITIITTTTMMFRLIFMLLDILWLMFDVYIIRMMLHWSLNVKHFQALINTMLRFIFYFSGLIVIDDWWINQRNDVALRSFAVGTVACFMRGRLLDTDMRCRQCLGFVLAYWTY